MSFFHVLLLVGGLILALMTLLWALSLVLSNSSIVDIFWGFGFIVIAFTSLALSTLDGLPEKIALALFVTFWGLRLSLHILFRNRGRSEDFRYTKWRQEHGDRWWWRSYFQVFLLQGLLMWIVSTPLVARMATDLERGTPWLEGLSLSIWMAGFLIETVADLQLARFKRRRKNKGHILTSGLWRTSRHPNYFGESLVWWAFFLYTASTGAWWTVFSPILMTFLLVRVSGVTLLERSLRKRPGYEAYVRRTSAFFPWFPKRD